MKAYLFSLAAGVMAEVLQSVISVKSPAPPTIALVGLPGMVRGEDPIPLARRWPASRLHRITR